MEVRVLYAGLDLGQRRDHSAIAVVERRNLYRAYGAAAFHSLAVRHVERLPLGKPYREVVERVGEVARVSRKHGGCALAVDATGVGAPVVEMLRGALLDVKPVGCEVTAVAITGGDRERESRGVWNVPKADLIAGVQVMLERGELRIPRDAGHATGLVRELVDVKAKFGGSGRVRVGADGAGEHDDLVIALALACWRARRKSNGFGTQRLPGI